MWQKIINNYIRFVVKYLDWYHYLTTNIWIATKYYSFRSIEGCNNIRGMQ